MKGLAIPLLAAAVLSSESGGPRPSAENDGPCGWIRFRITTEEELVRRLGRPCRVEWDRSWDDYQKGVGPADGSHRLDYGTWAVSCGTRDFGGIPFQGGLCHCHSPEASRSGPLGIASRASFGIKDGRVISAHWKYWDDTLEDARKALTAGKAFGPIDDDQPLNASFESTACSAGAHELSDTTLFVDAFAKN